MKNYYLELTKIDLDTAITELVEVVIPRFTKDKVLSVNICFDADNFKTGHRINKDLFLFYYRPNNYTQVVKSDEPLYKAPKLKFIVDHDSCWRDGTTRAIKEMAKEIEDKLLNEGYSIHVSFGILGVQLEKGKFQLTESRKEGLRDIEVTYYEIG